MNDSNGGPVLADLSYEEGMQRLTRLVDEIGRDDCPVDELETRVRQAADLLRELRRRLTATEVTVTEVLEELDREETED